MEILRLSLDHLWVSIALLELCCLMFFRQADFCHVILDELTCERVDFCLNFVCELFAMKYVSENKLIGLYLWAVFRHE